MLSVKQLYVYPVKSLQGIAQKNVRVLESGFEHDRILMLSEPDGSFITAREYPKLLQLKTTMIRDKIRVSLPTSTSKIETNKQTITLHFSEFSNSQMPTQIWGSQFKAHIAPIRVNRFFSDFLRKDVQLRWLGNFSSRRIKRYPDMSLNCADGYPYSLISQASFNYLQQRCPEKLDIRQFRGNIIIDGSLPFSEDGWQSIKIGSIIFDLIKPCSRCILTTLNVKSNNYLPDNEPLNTLSAFRLDQQGEIDFGMNMIARNQGEISIGDPIEVLAKKMPKTYIKKELPREPSLIEPLTIHFSGKVVNGNNKMTILEQLEQNQIQLPYSCRTGICGRCEVTLISGDVSPLTQSAIKPNNRILTCSCIPKNDIKIEPVKK